jgi:hypothetical protein
VLSTMSQSISSDDNITKSHNGGQPHLMRPRSTSSIIESDPSVIRDTYIQQQLVQRRSEYIHQHTLHLYTTTYNVAGTTTVNSNTATTSDLTQALNDWLIPQIQGLNESIDMYIICIQEIVPLNSTNLLVDHTQSHIWDSIIQSILNSRANIYHPSSKQSHTSNSNSNNSSNSGTPKHSRDPYTLLTMKWMVGLCTMIYTRHSLQPYITDIQHSNIQTGLYGYGGNKGAVVIHMNVYDTSLCIINSHLAPHQNYVAQRNADFHTIINRIKFYCTTKNHHIDTIFHKNQMTVFDHDIVYFIGDLNYRLDLLDLTAVSRYIENHEYAHLLLHDQLFQSQRTNQAFERFQESPIEFSPTYKYEIGEIQTYSTSKTKVRIPSYCDRILYYEPYLEYKKQLNHSNNHDHTLLMNGNGNTTTATQQHHRITSSSSGSVGGNSIIPIQRVYPLAYTAIPTVTLSDHKPGKHI